MNLKKDDKEKISLKKTSFVPKSKLAFKDGKRVIRVKLKQNSLDS